MTEFTFKEDPKEEPQGTYYWIMVVLDYAKDRALVLHKSPDLHSIDDSVQEDALDDSGLGTGWVKDAVPGLYKLTLSGWSHKTYEGDYDSGWDVSHAELIVAFPKSHEYLVLITREETAVHPGSLNNREVLRLAVDYVSDSNEDRCYQFSPADRYRVRRMLGGSGTGFLSDLIDKATDEQIENALIVFQHQIKHVLENSRSEYQSCGAIMNSKTGKYAK